MNSSETGQHHGGAVIEGRYFQDILDQPRALAATATALSQPSQLGRIAERLACGGYARVLLTGMGSSFHALHPLHLTLVAGRYPSTMVEASDLLFHQAAWLRPGTLVVVVSQSGASVEIVRLLERVPAEVDLVAVTNTPGSVLAARATVALMTDAGEEYSVSCKTYLAALLVLSWLGSVLCGEDPATARSELAQAAPAVSSYLANWRNHVAALRSELDGITSLFLVGRGASLATAGVGGLIIKESAHVHAEGMNSAAFRHGPFEMLSRQTYVLVFTGDAMTAALNRRLGSDVLRAGGRAGIVVEGGQSGPLSLPAGPERIRTILEFLPVEMISLALAANVGREAGRFTLGSKVTTIE